jgi:guanylate kinase
MSIHLLHADAEHEQPELNLPVILAGYTGSGKDTVSHRAIELAGRTVSRHFFHHTRSRFTDRAARPGEIQGTHGYFVQPEEFRKLKNSGEFYYDYQKKAYGGVNYGFSLPILSEELLYRHTFITGGEIDTSLGLKEALDEVVTDRRGKLEHVLHPVIIFVNRPREKIIEGIQKRDAPESEKQKRIAHVETNWERYPKALDRAQNGVELVWNVDCDDAAHRIMKFVETEVARQMNVIYGSRKRHGGPGPAFSALPALTFNQ